MKRKSLISVITLSSIIFLCSCSKTEPPVEKKLDVTVSLVCDEHVRSTSELVQTVEKGETISFKLQFDDEYIFDSSSDGVYQEENNVLEFDSNYGNKTIYITSCPLNGLNLNIDNNHDYGDIIVTPNKKSYRHGEEVTVKTTSKNRDFLCYTFDLPYRAGLKEKSGVPISYDNELTITMNSDVNLCVNYFETNSKIIEYDLNGGHSIKGKETIKTDYKEYNGESIFQASTINLSSYATYEDHVLESLNTKKDGSGQRIGIGSRIDNNFYTSNKITLYAQWKPYTNINSFEYVTNDNGVAITRCSSNLEEIVIPAYINDKAVTAIKANAFKDLSTAKSIIFPDTMKVIEDNAFSGMNNVTSITFYSSLESVTTAAFDMPNLHTLHINKNTNALDINYEEDNLSRYREAIINLGTSKKKVIFAGHSTIRVNHDLTPLDEKWGDDYNFFIYGATAGIHGYLLLMSIVDVIGPNDYVIIPVWPILNYSTSRNISFFQYDFDRLAVADYQIIKDFIWTAFTDYRLTCTAEIGVTAVLPEASNYARFDKYGMNLEDIPSDDVNNKSPYDYSHYLDEYDASSFSYLDLFASSVATTKDHILLTWNTYNQNNIDDLSMYESFEQRIRTGFPDYTYFDTQLENIYPGNYFNKNDFMHLSTTGTVVRVQRWLDELPL